MKVVYHDPLEANVNWYTMADPEEVGQKAARLIKAQLNRKPDSVLVFPTGNTPIPMYACLRAMTTREQYRIDWAKARLFHLDEYLPRGGAPLAESLSFRHYLNEALWGLPELENACKYYLMDYLESPMAYEQAIRDCGGPDLVILGIGRNGHIAFLEPGFDPAHSPTGVVTLKPQTIEANFGDRSLGWTDQAVSLGWDILQTARHILLLATGDATKGVITREAFSPETIPSAQLPASLLRTLTHAEVSVITDFPFDKA
ncbi:MAG: 6-phosphogluconolactonase [Candidatus Melainabacteria bacterium]